MRSWQFTTVLYLLRWIVVLPIAFLLGFLFPGGGVSLSGAGPILWFWLILGAPLSKPFSSASFPGGSCGSLSSLKIEGRPWNFVAVAAAMMTLLHLGAGPVALGPAAITGAFLGYTYSHFAPADLSQAFVHTSGFHAAINLVGLLVISAS